MYLHTPFRARRAFGVGALAATLGLALAVPAAASPRLYDVVPGESSTNLTLGLFASVNAEPDLLDEFPQTTAMSGFSNSPPSSSSTATADVGLPNSFNTGTVDEITFNNLVIDYPSVAPFFTLGFVTIPLDITGSSTQLFAAESNLTSFNITLNAPFTTALTPTGNTNEWLWAGVADVTISGTLDTFIIIPSDSVPDIEIPDTPFSQSVMMPLAGTFSGDNSSTEIHVGLNDGGSLNGLDLGLPPISEQFNLGDLDLVTVTVSFADLTLADLTTDVVFRNNTPIPEPGTAALVALGLAGLAARRRR